MKKEKKQATENKQGTEVPCLNEEKAYKSKKDLAFGKLQWTLQSVIT